MTQPGEPPKDEHHPSSDLSDPLPTWARGLALGLGAAAGVAGGYAVFASENQAGTAALLLIAGLFVLLGLQGTPMRRLTRITVSSLLNFADEQSAQLKEPNTKIHQR